MGMNQKSKLYQCSQGCEGLNADILTDYNFLYAETVGVSPCFDKSNTNVVFVEIEKVLIEVLL